MTLNSSMLKLLKLIKHKKKKEWRPQQRIVNETYHRRDDIRWKTQDMIVEESDGEFFKRKDGKGRTHSKISVGIGNMNHKAEKMKLTKQRITEEIKENNHKIENLQLNSHQMPSFLMARVH